MVYVDHLKRFIGDGISENQHISDSDKLVDIEPENESYMSSVEDVDNDNALRPSLHSHPSSTLQLVKQSRRGRFIKSVIRYSP